MVEVEGNMIGHCAVLVADDELELGGQEVGASVVLPVGYTGT